MNPARQWPGFSTVTSICGIPREEFFQYGCHGNSGSILFSLFGPKRQRIQYFVSLRKLHRYVLLICCRRPANYRFLSKKLGFLFSVNIRKTWYSSCVWQIDKHGKSSSNLSQFDQTQSNTTYKNKTIQRNVSHLWTNNTNGKKIYFVLKRA